MSKNQPSAASQSGAGIMVLQKIALDDVNTLRYVGRNTRKEGCKNV